jgi:mannose-6-phosphate isomerase-like protein (cupin superfamily)
MSTSVAAAGAIENPLSGERIVIRETGAETGGRVLTWELSLDPRGRVPSAHAHPSQEERFRVLDGRMRFRVAGRLLAVGPGETVTVPPGTVHHFANAGPGTARLAVETRPALAMEAMLRTAAALAQEQHAAGRRFPRLVDLALFMGEFEREVAAPYLPRLVRIVMRTIASLAISGGFDTRYRRLRDPGGGSAMA